MTDLILLIIVAILGWLGFKEIKRSERKREAIRALEEERDLIHDLASQDPMVKARVEEIDRQLEELQDETPNELLDWLRDTDFSGRRPGKD